MAWYDEITNDCDVVLSTRVRYARNLEDYPFDLCDASKVSDEMIERVINACQCNMNELRMSHLTPNARLALCEQHYISPSFMDQTNGVLIYQEDKGIYLMTPEEDHIRLQVLGAGYCPEILLERADNVLKDLEDTLRFSYDKKLGYLTRCPTNLGLALRISVMVFLPGLVFENGIARLHESLSSVGYNLRGMYGEGSKSIGALFQISNRYSLGYTKRDIITGFSDMIEKVIAAEKLARSKLNLENLADRSGRAYGILSYAKKMSYDEFLSHYSNLRLGYAMKLQLPRECSLSKLDSLLIKCAPGMITGEYQCVGSNERDLCRAKYLFKILH